LALHRKRHKKRAGEAGGKALDLGYQASSGHCLTRCDHDLISRDVSAGSVSDCRLWEVIKSSSDREPPLSEKMIGDHAEPDEQAKRRADEK